MSLALCAHAGRHANFSAGLDGHSRALVRPDAGALHVTDHADSHVLSLGSETWLFRRDELFIADHLHGLFKSRQIVAAVVHQRRRVLEHDFVIVRETIRTQQIPLSNLHAVESHLARGDVEQALAHEHAVLPPGAAHRRHDGLVGEDGRELALVMWNVVWAEQRALAVDGNGQAVGIVGAGVEEKHVAHAENAAVFRQRHLRVVQLPALLRRGVEIFLPVFRPFQRFIQANRGPWQQDFLRVEHHDLRAETTAHERRDHIHL